MQPLSSPIMKRDMEHYATDIYQEWKKVLTKAHSTVVVFTPYFYALLPHLFNNASVADITVGTDISPQSSVREYLGQLRAISKVLKTGNTLPIPT